MVSDRKLGNSPVLLGLYQISCLLCLCFHILNSLEIGGVKLFYIPTATTFVLSFFVKAKTEGVEYVLLAFCLLTLLSGFISYEPTSFGVAISVCVIIVGFSKLRHIDVGLIIRLSVFATTVMLIVLLGHYFAKPDFRYQGYYNDPNYFVLSLLLLAYLNLIVLKGNCSKVMATFIVVNLVLTTILELLTQSRTGLLCVLLLYAVSSWKNIVKRPVLSVLIISVVAVASFQYISSHYAKELDFFVQRFDGRRKDDVGSASELRWKLTEQNLQFIAEHPAYIPFGLGPGATNNANIPNQKKKFLIRDHDSFTSAFSEHGIVCFVLYVAFVAMIIGRVRKMLKADSYGWLRVSFLISIVIFSVSVWCLNYLPFWMGLFLVANSTYMIRKEIEAEAQDAQTVD